MDSTLAAILLDRVAQPTLLTATFGLDDRACVRGADAAAAKLPFEHRTVDLDVTVARTAVEKMRTDGNARSGIQYVHESVLNSVADGAGIDQTIGGIADGITRGDRVPRIDDDWARSLEDRHDIAYLRPLAGLGRRTLDVFAAEHLEVVSGASESMRTGDYEQELRWLIAEDFGQPEVERLFPPHTQTSVRGLR